MADARVAQSLGSTMCRPRSSALSGVFAGVLILSVCFSTHLRAQQPGREPAAGVVLDGSAAVIPKPTVVLKSVGSGLTLVIPASSKGEFSFPAVTPGQYILSVAAPGFADAIQVIDLPASGLTT